MKTKITKLIKSKLFIFSLACYLLIPLLFVCIKYSNVSFRTKGTYEFIDESGVHGRITLNSNNTLSFSFSNEEMFLNDSEVKYHDRVVKWVVSYTYEYESFDKEKYKFVSMEQVSFLDKNGSSFFQFFKIGNCLYSKYLLADTLGGGQKCYTKK